MSSTLPPPSPPCSEESLNPGQVFVSLQCCPCALHADFQPEAQATPPGSPCAPSTFKHPEPAPGPAHSRRPPRAPPRPHGNKGSQSTRPFPLPSPTALRSQTTVEWAPVGLQSAGCDAEGQDSLRGALRGEAGAGCGFGRSERWRGCSRRPPGNGTESRRATGVRRRLTENAEPPDTDPVSLRPQGPRCSEWRFGAGT